MPFSPYLQDEKMRDAYRESSAESLDNIEAALTQLSEAAPDRDALVRTLLGELHSFKGDSRMLGVAAGEIAHEMELVIAAVRSGQLQPSDSVRQPLLEAKDACERLVAEATDETPSNIDARAVAATLKGLLLQTPVAIVSQYPSIPPATQRSEQYQETARQIIVWATEDCRSLAELERVAREVYPAALEPEVDRQTLVRELIAWVSSDLQMSDLEELQAAIARAAEITTVPAVVIVTADDDIDQLLQFEVAETTPESPPVPGSAERLQEGKIEIETVRVSARHLERLGARSRALLVAKQRLESRLQELESLLDRFCTADLSALNAAEAAPALLALQEEGKMLRGERPGEVEGFSRIVAELNTSISGLCLFPLSTIFKRFSPAVREIARDLGKDVNLVTEGEEILLDKKIIDAIKDILLHLLRNAIDHGIESPQERQSAQKPGTGTIFIHGLRRGNSLTILVADDGRGLNTDAIAQKAIALGLCSEQEIQSWSVEKIQSLIFEPGFSTRAEVTEISGQGVGLDVVRRRIKELNGEIEVSSQPGMSCVFRLDIGVDLTMTDALIVEASGQKFAISTDYVLSILEVSGGDISAFQENASIRVEDERVSIRKLSTLLGLQELEGGPKSDSRMPCLLLHDGTRKTAIVVDRLHAHKKGIATELKIDLLARVPYVLGATVLASGEICIVLNPKDLITAEEANASSGQIDLCNTAPERKTILLVEDSPVIRLQLEGILKSGGYEVLVANDGREGLEVLEKVRVDAVVSDIEMPNMSGIEMTQAIRSSRKDVPIILVTTLARAEDRQLGLAVGANAYLTKGDFDRSLLLKTLQELT